MCFDSIIMQLNQFHIDNTNNGLILMSNVSLSPPYFIMATIRVYRSFVPVTLPLGDQGHMNISKDLLSLRFNLRI